MKRLRELTSDELVQLYDRLVVVPKAEYEKLKRSDQYSRNEHKRKARGDHSRGEDLI